MSAERIMKIKNNSAPLLITILLIKIVFSQDTSNDFNYSTIAESYGYAFDQDNQEIGILQEYAYNDAKKKLLEKTLVHIKSYSKVENFVLEYDLVESESEGFLRIIEKKDLGYTKDNKYCVWIKAEVIYLFNPANSYQDTDQSTNEPLFVKIWTEKEKYFLNEKVKIFIQPNKDCYLRVIYNDAKNDLLQIFPNKHKTDNHFKADKLYQIPDDSDPYELTVSSPLGIERITVFASTSQFEQSQMDDYGPNFYKFEGNEKEYSLKTRGVKITNQEVPVEFYQESCKIIVEEK